MRHLSMDQWMRFGDRDRPVVLCWPNSGGYSRHNRVMIQLSSSGRPPSGAPARRGRRLMRRTSRGVWHSRSTANTKKKGWHPEFEAKNRNPDESAPVAL